MPPRPWCRRKPRSNVAGSDLSEGSSPSSTFVRLFANWTVLVLTTGALAICDCAAPPQRRATAARDTRTTLTVAPGTLEFALPRPVCDSGVRVGDTVTTSVTRPVPQLDHNLYSIGRDTTVPANLRAFLRVSRVGSATGRRWFAVDFAVDSFALDGRQGQATVSPLLVDPEAVSTSEPAGGAMIQCYRARLTGQITSALVLREK
jgi:hypothetical protein